MGSQKQLLLSYTGSSSIVKTTQQFSITIAAAGTSGTATISNAGTVNSFIFWGGIAYGATGASSGGGSWPHVVLTNATTVTATLGSAATAAVTIYGTVVTFQSSVIKSNQIGSTVVASGSASTNTAISAVTLANAIVLYNGVTPSSTAVSALNSGVTAQLTSTTNVSCNTGAATTAATTIYYTVLEFQPGILNSAVQQGSIAMTAATTATATISGVTTGNTILIFNGLVSSATAQNSNFQPYIALTNGTTVTATKGASSSATRTIKFTAVEFRPAQINSMQRSQGTIATTTASKNVTVSTVTLAKSFANYLGCTSNTATDTEMTDLMASVTMSNTTTLVMARGAAETAVLTLSWELPYFI